MQRSLLLAAQIQLLCAIYLTSICPGQDVLGDPRLEIVGEPGQTVAVSVRYFDNNQAVETIHSRTEITGAAEPETLAFGHSGLRVQVLSAKSEPVRVRLLDGEQEVLSATSEGSGVVDFRRGSVPADDDLQVPRAFPNTAEQQLIQSFLTAIRTADSRSIVSDIPISNIDWQTLDAYFQALTDELGELQSEADAMDRWIGWEGSLGARVLSGSVDFASASCRFKLMVVEGKLVDVEPECREMPIDWFIQKPDIAEYIQQSHELVRAIFAGDAVKAQSLFSRRYHEEVTVASLVELSQQLQNQFGFQVVELEFKQSKFGSMPPPSASKLLSLDSILILETGKRCVCRTEFVIPSGESNIGRAHLAAVHVNEAWQSAEPDLANQLTRAIRLITGDDAEANLAGFVELLHPDLQPRIDEGKLGQFLRTTSANLGTLLDDSPDYDLWRASTGTQLTASGPAAFSSSDRVTLQASFADDHLVGLTVLAEDFAVSTLDQIPRFENVERRGIEFWTAIFHGETQAAHSLLGAGFRGRMPLDEFDALIRESGITSGPALKTIRVDQIRIADRDQRLLPAMLVGYFVAEFEDGSYQSLSSEIGMPSEDESGPVFNLTTDSQVVFPLESSQTAELFYDAFLSFDANAVIDLVDQRASGPVDAAILQAFLDQLRETLGDEVATPPTSSLLREYSGNQQYLRLSSVVGAENIPVEATFERGRLQKFFFQHADMAEFADKIEDTSGLEKQATDFLTCWFSGDLTETSQYLVASLRNAAVEKRFTDIRNEFAVSLGNWNGCKLLDATPIAGVNQIRLDMELEFEKGKRTLQLTYDVNALGGLISAVNFQK